MSREQRLAEALSGYMGEHLDSLPSAAAEHACACGLCRVARAALSSPSSEGELRAEACDECDSPHIVCRLCQTCATEIDSDVERRSKAKALELAAEAVEWWDLFIDGRAGLAAKIRSLKSPAPAKVQTALTSAPAKGEPACGLGSPTCRETWPYNKEPWCIACLGVHAPAKGGE